MKWISLRLITIRIPTTQILVMQKYELVLSIHSACCRLFVLSIHWSRARRSTHPGPHRSHFAILKMFAAAGRRYAVDLGEAIAAAARQEPRIRVTLFRSGTGAGKLPSPTAQSGGGPHDMRPALRRSPCAHEFAEKVIPAPSASDNNGAIPLHPRGRLRRRPVARAGCSRAGGHATAATGLPVAAQGETPGAQ